MCQLSDRSTALAAFIARKAEIDTILARLAALSAEHFNCTPDEITWADVGTLGSYLEGSMQTRGVHYAAAAVVPPSLAGRKPR